MFAGLPKDMRAVIQAHRSTFTIVLLLSIVLNVMTLTGSIYMMMVYDSVLPSHSLPSLFGLFALAVVLFAFQGVFDAMRSRILGDIANTLHQNLSPKIQRVMVDGPMRGTRWPGDGLGPMRDLDSVRSFLAGSGLTTLIDLPWIIFFIAILMMLHVWLGVAALVGGTALVALTFVTNRVTKEPTELLSAVGAYRNAQAETNIRHAEMLTALGMKGRMLDRSRQLNGYYLATQREMTRGLSGLGSASRIGRIILQSLLLTVGAILVIDGKASGGVIFASSILSARALAPVDQAIANWKGFAAARLGFRRLCDLLRHFPDNASGPTELPAPTREMKVEQLFVGPPGAQQPTVQGIDFALQAGDGLAIIGPSAAGKSTLARALMGIWLPMRGAVRLDGAALNQWAPDRLGEYFGYLPQTVELLEGTIADNIARFEDQPVSGDIIAAAQAAGVHDMIVSLPQGYETPVGADGRGLSAGQQQRIGLARALYRDPFVVLLDEPNSNLDADGDAALEKAIGSVRARGGIVIIIAHRPSALANVNLVLVLRAGRQEAIGPRDEVVQKLIGRPRPIGETGNVVAVPKGGR